MLKPNALPLQVSLWWMPLVWATRIVDQARAEGKIASDPAVQTLLGEISKIRIGLTRVQHYDMISVPLVYTQARFGKKNRSITYVILNFCQLRINNDKASSKDFHLKVNVKRLFSGLHLGCLLLLPGSCYGCTMGVSRRPQRLRDSLQGSTSFRGKRHADTDWQFHGYIHYVVAFHK